mgnify:CR=1 FL=1
MSDNDSPQQLAEAHACVAALQQELAETNRGLIVLTMELDQRMEEIRRLNAELEQRVEQRTAALRAANESLQWEITERRQAEEEIRRLNRDLERHSGELEAVNKELEAFSYSVSHDLRAPLRHIDGYARLLQKHVPQLEEKSGRYLNAISDSAKEMGRLIDDLLAFSRMGRAEMRRATVDLGRLVKDVLHEIQEEARGRDIVWNVGPLPQVEGDPAMLRLVLVNLISNAVKYTRPRPQARIEIGCTAKDDETVVFVRDNGVGFDMQYVDKLFGVFQRLHSPADFEGTGIGLANVRRIIHRHGGRTWAEGSVGEGATLYFSLPNTRKDSS